MAPDSHERTSYTAVPSFGQRRLWVLDRLVPGGHVYNELRVDRLQGPLDVAALAASFDALAARHDMLRTRFEVIDGEPQQVIAASMKVPLPIDDLTALAADERDAAARRMLEAECALPFDLERGPLLRARLLRLAPDEHWLATVTHHIITDRWSSGIICRDLSLLYEAQVRGVPPAMKPLPVQYGDYAVWQNELLKGAALEREVGHWRNALADLQPLDLLTDHPRPAIQDYRGGREIFEIDAATLAGLRALGRREGATLFMVLVAAFHVLLHRYTGQEDLAVGVPIAGRNKPELEELIGFFVNTLVLRGDLRGEPSFIAYLARVRQTALEAYSHQDVPFEKLVEVLAPARDLSRNPLFQVAFALQNNPTHAWRLHGISTDYVVGLRGESAKFDLAFTLVEIEGRLRARIDYAAALFEPETIARIGAHYRRLLASIIADPQQMIGRLPLVDEDERRQLIDASRGVAVAYPNEASITALFESEAAQRGQAIAVQDGDAVLSYGELNARANQLAHWLRGRAPQLPPRIGVCLDRGADLVVAMLGILKAGAAYMPLDPALPRERLALMYEDAQLSLVVGDTRLLPMLPHREQVVCMDRDAAAIANAPSTDPPSSTRADDIAYVMYTSGSTGVPKGVSVRHRAVVNLVRSADYAALSADEVIAQIANPAFDAATFEVWGALLHGARLAIVPRDTALSPTAFSTYIVERGITTLFLTTALFNQIARDAPAAFARCRNVLWGGEAAEPRHVAAVLATGAPQRLSHVYGPTETTTFATWHDVRAVAEDATGIPIGRAIANAEVYVLDRYREPCPPDVSGEIFIGGPGVAAGYLGRAELTAERFVANPFAADAQAKLYRTGDVARRRGNGAIDFLGRADRQVKVRGHRIEPGEIEAALIRVPSVREAVVVLHGNTSDDKRLTAYVVPSGPPPEPEDLWRELRRTLPDYMVPAAVVSIAAIPLTPNGKVDRSKLPDPKDLAQGRVGWHIPPLDPSQRMIAAIWEDLLGVKGIGARDNFFDRGGHSLLAARMVDRVQAILGVEIPLATLFTHATLEEFSRAVRDESLRKPTQFVAINTRGERPPIFFLHGDFTGGGFFSKAIANEIGYEWPFYAVHPHGLLEDNVPDTIEAMAIDRLAILREQRPTGPYVLGGHCAGALVALEMARRLVSEGEKVPLVFVIDARAPWQVKRVFEGISFGQVSATPRRRRIAAEAPPPADVPEEDGLPAGDLFGRYRKAMRSYVCAPYGGAIAVLRPESQTDMRPSLGWSQVSDNVSVDIVPGSHHTAITRHVKELGATLKARLDACDAVAASAPART